MKKSSGVETKNWKSRAKLAIAGLALAGALAGGVAVTNQPEVPAEDTTEVAWSWNWRTSRSGVSWR